ncbi:MAG: hypothetical protein MI742_16275 [Desulfobacterales bacterium]|nr:hypothetical protein [Desulfobacterales bacterium]
MNRTLFTLCGYILMVSAASTLVPWAGASEANVLGFRSLCPFAPFSTLICLMGANILFTLKKRAQPKDGE